MLEKMTQEELKELEKQVEAARKDVQAGRFLTPEQSKKQVWDIVQRTIDGSRNAA
ncbi:MAG: hypothetical protein SPE06_12095 [[Actinobacillus] rossii]|uniref:Uncharacterized protein n=1 Tax=[Actinobacillus] rossii TaxID=123820 RepID=A0A380TXL5_9PAST|nr:hypothetical protein [[Actinobacillus] rossii]MDY4507083.1 hypothetical protein [[Actinobacillus] rossii]SUT92811.1 Uncharacterised protein [[Actinobacillus] rossii]